MRSRFFHGFHSPGSLRQAAYDYLETVKTKGLSLSTYKQREDSIKLFVKWLDERQILLISQLTPEVLEDYQQWLIEAPLGKINEKQRPRTIRTRLTDLRLLFRFLIKENLILENPFSTIDIGKLPPYPIPECLTESEVIKVLSYPDTKTILGIRDRAILETLYSTGIRRQELLNLNLADIDHGQGIVKVIKGKGGKSRLVPIGKRALNWINKYLGESSPILLKIPTDALFLGYRGDRLGKSAVGNLIRDAKKANAIKKRGAAHLLRHSCATHMLKRGADIRVIQQILGHSEINTTMIYARLDIRDLKKIHQRTHPAEKDANPGDLL